VGAGASDAASEDDRAAPAAHGCLPSGNGYLRARIRGALDLDIDWGNAEIECDGGPRPDGSGVRVTVHELRQERVGALGGPKRSWRIIARGFCIAPASTLNSDARILVNRFDFAGSAVFDDAE
jgi:hypothetical protein